MTTTKKKNTASKNSNRRYRADVHIVMTLHTVRAKDVTVTPGSGDVSRHPVISFTELDPNKKFTAKLRMLERKSKVKKSYYYDQMPRFKDVASRFVNDKLGASWQLYSKIPSCYSPPWGWIPRQPGEPCEAYYLTERNQGRQPDQRLWSGQGQLVLRFSVSVHVYDTQHP